MKIPEQIKTLYRSICCIIIQKQTMEISICDENMLMLKFSNNRLAYKMTRDQFSRFKRQVEVVARKKFILFEDSLNTASFFDIDYARKCEPLKFSNLAEITEGKFVCDLP